MNEHRSNRYQTLTVFLQERKGPSKYDLSILKPIPCVPQQQPQLLTIGGRGGEAGNTVQSMRYQCYRREIEDRDRELEWQGVSGDHAAVRRDSRTGYSSGSYGSGDPHVSERQQDRRAQFHPRLLQA